MASPPAPSHRQGIERLQADAACAKRCRSAGGKSGRQETQGSCTRGKHEGIAHVREVTRPVPTPPVRRCPHPFTPIERGQREKEREERREEKREPRTSRAGSPSTRVRPSGQRDPVPLRQGEVGWTDSAKQWYKVLKAKKAGLDAARKTEQAATTQGRPDGGVKRHPSLVLPLS